MADTERSTFLLERPGKLLTYLVLIDLVLVVLFPLAVGSGSLTLILWFGLDNETSIPTWFSAAQLLVAGLLVLLASTFRDRGASVSRAFYMLVGLGLIFLSADEASAIHERLTPLAAKYAEFIPVFREENGAWITIYAVIGGVLLVLNARNILAMWKTYRDTVVVFFAGFAVLVAGAGGVEIAGYYAMFASDVVQLMLEEGLEMIGGSIILVSTAIFLHAHVRWRAVASGSCG